jgi:hypothetical protein
LSVYYLKEREGERGRRGREEERDIKGIINVLMYLTFKERLIFND